MQKLSELKLISRQLVRAQPAVADVILFGSAVRAKGRPDDIDVCLLVAGKVTGIAKFKAALARAARAEIHITILHLADFLNSGQPLWKTIMHEGISLTREMPLTELLGFMSHVLFWYSLEKLKPVAKIRFSYALLGRKGGKGLLHELGGEYLGKCVIMVPVGREDTIREFLARWRVPYSRRRILVEK